MKIDFLVHNVTPTPIAVMATVGEEEVPATIAGLEVELVSAADALHGSLTLRFVGMEAKEAAAKFRTGETVAWSL